MCRQLRIRQVLQHLDLGSKACTINSGIRQETGQSLDRLNALQKAPGNL